MTHLGPSNPCAALAVLHSLYSPCPYFSRLRDLCADTVGITGKHAGSGYVGITGKQSGMGHVGITGMHVASGHDHSVSHICVASGQSIIRVHPRTCTEKLTKSEVYYELMRALCEETMVCIAKWCIGRGPLKDCPKLCVKQEHRVWFTNE
jgi:hypothetical protein